jgi:hypothetical protein
MTKNNLYESIKMSEDELMHYGILGMHWGIRRYQDYGEGGYDPDHEGRFVGERISKKEMKAQAEKEKRLRKMREAAAKKRKAEVKAAKKQEKINKMKEKLIKKCNMEKIYKKRKYFTTEELEDARIRNQELIEVRNTKNAKKAPDPHKMERVLNLVSRVGQVAAAAVPVLDAVSRYKQIQQSDLNMELSKMKSMNDATTSKIETLMKLNPKAAAEYTSRIFGTEIEYSPKKEAPKPGDVKTMSEAIAKIDKNAAARYLSDVTGYKVSGDAQGVNIPETKKLKGSIGDLKYVGGGQISKLLERRAGGSTQKPTSEISNSPYSFNFGGKDIKSGFSQETNTKILGVLNFGKAKPLSEINPGADNAYYSPLARSIQSKSSKSTGQVRATGGEYYNALARSILEGSGRKLSGNNPVANNPSLFENTETAKPAYNLLSQLSPLTYGIGKTKQKAMSNKAYEKAWRKKRGFLG